MTDTLKNIKVLLPMIRQVMPNIMAQQIVGVQPMGAAGMLFNRDQSYLSIHQNKKYWPHRIVIGDWYDIGTAERFCYDNFRSRNWRNVTRYFYFKRHEDAALFTLRWGA